jgi:hypothetical protein
LLHGRGSSELSGRGAGQGGLEPLDRHIVRDLGLAVSLYSSASLGGGIASPQSLLHPDNDIAGDRFTTPKHIVPEWYFVPFYGALRSVGSKPLGVLGFIAAVGALAAHVVARCGGGTGLCSRVLSASGSGAAAFLGLGELGGCPPSFPWSEAAGLVALGGGLYLTVGVGAGGGFSRGLSYYCR